MLVCSNGLMEPYLWENICLAGPFLAQVFVGRIEQSSQVLDRNMLTCLCSTRSGGAHARYGGNDWTFMKCREHMSVVSTVTVFNCSCCEFNKDTRYGSIFGMKSATKQVPYFNLT